MMEYLIKMRRTGTTYHDFRWSFTATKFNGLRPVAAFEGTGETPATCLMHIGSWMTKAPTEARENFRETPGEELELLMHEQEKPNPVDHSAHGRGDASGPLDPDCPCIAQRDECAVAGCGYCRADLPHVDDSATCLESRGKNRE